jgi:hypothetical protein
MQFQLVLAIKAIIVTACGTMGRVGWHDFCYPFEVVKESGGFAGEINQHVRGAVLQVLRKMAVTQLNR